MNFSDHLPALIYLKNKVHKWRNIALLLAIFSIMVLLKIFFGDISGDVIESDRIAVIKIEGVIVDDPFRQEALKKLHDQESTKAVIIKINSPGGDIVSSEILYNEIKKISQKKPVVVVMESIAASGGYMAAIASNYIIAHNGTLTGSIGVLMESSEFTELASKIGVKFNSYKSSPLKGSPSPYEKETPELRQAIQDSIIDSYDFFTNLVKQNRGDKINKTNYSKIFDGRVFTGRQALEFGLIDKVGDFNDALEYLKTQEIDSQKIPVKEVIIFEEKTKFIDQILNSLSSKIDLDTIAPRRIGLMTIMK